MASILKVDSMQGVTSAGNITITSEGGSATMQLQQGVAKAWIDIVTGSSIGDSLNVTSFTDNGAGDYTQNFTNALSNSNYSTVGTGGSGRSSSATVYWGGYKSVAPTTTAARTAFLSGSGSAGDPADACSSTHGDLA